MFEEKKNYLHFLNISQHRFCSRSSVAKTHASIYKNDLAGGSSVDQRLTTGLETLGQKRDRFH